MKVLRFLLPILPVLFLCNCVSTVESRIEKNSVKFDSLPSKHRRAIEKGQVIEGMNQDAVYFAWGRPNSVSKGGSGGKRVETWRYSGQEPVFVNTIGVGHGYGRGRCRGTYYDVSPTIHYVPYTRARVQFTNDRVSKWER